MKKYAALFLLCFFCFALPIQLCFTLPAQAVEPGERLADPVLEARARALSRQLRCLVCQGEDIDESAAPLAADLRKLVRARLTAGDSDDAALEYIRNRYGDYVLLRPPLKPATVPLWAAPGLALLAGLAVVVLYLRRRPRREGG